MSVHLLKDGRWIVHYRNPGAPPAFIRHYFGRGIEAETKARDFNDSLGFKPRNTRTPDRDSKTFSELAQDYLMARAGHMERSTLDRLYIKFVRIILPRIGAIDVRRLTPDRIDQYILKRMQSVKRVTVHNEVTYIQAVLNWAVKRRYIMINPLAGYEKPRRDDAVIQPVTADEARRILAVSPPHLVRALSITYYTGLRPGIKELLRLKWSNVDWSLNVILVESARKRGPFARTVPIHTDFLPPLRRWYDQDLASGKKEDDYIVTYKGRPVNTFSKSFTMAKKKAGITRQLPPYAFRHSFVTNLLGAGGDLKATSEIVGHSRIDTTTRIYQHTNLTLYRDSINKLPRLDIPEK